MISKKATQSPINLLYRLFLCSCTATLEIFPCLQRQLFSFSSHCCLTIHLTFAEDVLFFLSPYQSIILFSSHKKVFWYATIENITCITTVRSHWHNLHIIVFWSWSDFLRRAEQKSHWCFFLVPSRPNKAVSSLKFSGRFPGASRGRWIFFFFFSGLAKWQLYWSVNMHTVGRIRHGVFPVTFVASIPESTACFLKCRAAEANRHGSKQAPVLICFGAFCLCCLSRTQNRKQKLDFLEQILWGAEQRCTGAAWCALNKDMYQIRK